MEGSGPSSTFWSVASPKPGIERSCEGPAAKIPGVTVVGWGVAVVLGVNAPLCRGV